MEKEFVTNQNHEFYEMKKQALRKPIVSVVLPSGMVKSLLENCKQKTRIQNPTFSKNLTIC